MLCTEQWFQLSMSILSIEITVSDIFDKSFGYH